MAKTFRIRENGSHYPTQPSDTKGNMIFSPQQVEAVARKFSETLNRLRELAAVLDQGTQTKMEV